MDAGIKGRKVAIIGLGVSNMPVIRFVIGQDPSDLTIFDTRENPPLAGSLPDGLELVLGPLDAQVLKEFQLIVISPGISIFDPQIEEAARAGVEVVGDIELFARVANAPIIGITGSNGKSTVTALTGFIAKKAGIRVAIGANFGNPVFDILNPDIELYVLELSSFELETTRSLHLKAATILNVSEDHLDRYHGDIEEYAAYKRRIYDSCDYVVVNRDDRRTYPQKSADRQTSFGLDNRDYGRLKEDGETYLTVNGEKVINTCDMKICGTHNELNALACMALSDALEIPRQVQLEALREFVGLEHRCQLVRTIENVSFYNDSKATNVASAQAAIEGLCERHPQGIILLGGGLGKGQDFTPLKKYIGKEVSDIFAFGKDAQKLLDLDAKRCHKVINMREALNQACAVAKAGQAILLSPACASFDQFKGFEDRGRIFVYLVRNLPEQLKRD